MTITFSINDRRIAERELLEAGLDADDRAIDDLLDSVAAAFKQQYVSELTYLVTEILDTEA